MIFNTNLNGFLFHDEERTQQLMQEPNYHDLGCRTRIWKRLCLLNDESVVRIKMLGASTSNDPFVKFMSKMAVRRMMEIYLVLILWIILTQYRVYNEETCDNERVAKIIEK
eukprot:619798_1